MKPERRHVGMKLRVDLLAELDQYVQECQTSDERTSRTEIVEQAIRLLLRRRGQRHQTVA